MKSLICFSLIICGLYSLNAQNIDNSKILTINQSVFKVELIDENMNPLLNSISCNCYNDKFPSLHMVGINWSIGSGGDMNFEIIPNDKKDDLDFILYKYNNESESPEEIRCSASGKTFGSSSAINCDSHIGINENSKYINSKPGCSEESGFLANVLTAQNEGYLLLVNNISSSNGFEISFTGDAQIEHSLNIDNANDPSVNVFPVPVKQSLNLSLNNISNINSIEIFDSKMLKVLEIKNPLNQIDVKELSPGLYYLIIFNDRGVIRKPFIKF
ncbi:MAG TPA: T9SS type A sorting domain-containing protein [Saprospiraceae bacterium]|nr:T9SS type A sorting domain-containing protein [Saprospiraceae bacterium]